MFNPLDSVFGVGILLMTPIVFHITAFQKSKKLIHVMSSLAIGNFILISSILFFGLFIIFDAKLIFLVSLLIACVVGRWVQKSNILKNVFSADVSFTMVVLTLLFAIFTWTMQKNIDFYRSDSLHAYLPWARIIVQENIIPAFHLQNNMHYIIGGIVPLLYTQLAFLFSFFGSYKDTIAISIPLFYSSLTIFLLLGWAKEYYNEKTSLFALATLFACPLFLIDSRHVMQEAPLLFFFTMSLYFLFKYNDERKTVFLVLVAIAASLCTLAKYSGCILSLLILFFLILKSKNKKEIYKICTVYALFHIPIIIWLLREMYFYGLTFPFFRNIFGGKFQQYISFMHSNSGLFSWIKEEELLYYTVYKRTIFALPALVFAFLHMYNNRKKAEIKFILASFITLLISLMFMIYPNPRYFIYPFLGIFALYSGIEISQIYAKFHDKLFKMLSIKISKNKKKLIDKLLLLASPPSIILVVSFLMPAPGNFLIGGIVSEREIFNPDPGYSHFRVAYYPWDTTYWEVIDYLSMEEGEKEIRIFGVSQFLQWYGNYTMLSPRCLSFLVLNEGELDYTQESEYYYKTFKKLNISYVYTSPEWPELSAGNITQKINEDKDHFKLVFDKDPIKLWKLK